MASVVDGTNVPVSPVPASSSNIGSPNGSLPDLEGTGIRASTMEDKINEILKQIAKLPLLMQSMSRFEDCVWTLSQTVASYDAKITNIERTVNSLAARVTTLETNATPVYGGSCSASSGNVLGHSDGSTATGSKALGLLTTTGKQDADSIRGLKILGNVQRIFQQAYQNTLQNRFSSCQTRIRNKSQMSGLCGQVQG